MSKSLRLFNSRTTCCSFPKSFSVSHHLLQQRMQRLQQQQQHLSPSQSRSVSSTTSTAKMSDSNGLTKVFTANACPPAGPYSQAIKAAGQVWTAGQIPADAQGNLVTGSIAEKTAQCCKNLQAILEEAGSEIGKTVRVGIFLSDMSHFKEMNGEYEKWFTHKPARTCVAVKQLPLGVDVEIEAIAIQ